MKTARPLARPELFLQIGFAAVTFGLAAAGAGTVLQYAFAPLALIVAVILYLRAPTSDYIGFCYWIWMLSPLIRRLAELHTGFQSISPIIVTPLIVTGVCCLRMSRKSFWSFAPFNIIIIVYIYGAIVGILQGQLLAPVYTLISWTLPIIFGCFILTNINKIEEISGSIFRTLVVSGFIQALYALDQYFVLRPWDAYWMISSQMASIGLPVAQMVRVFGTLNSPGPFAIFMCAALLAMFSSASMLRWIAIPPALVAFALSLVRSSWGGFAIGLAVLLTFSRGRQRFNDLVVGAIGVAAALPLLSYGPIADQFAARFSTIFALQDDNSFAVRAALTNYLLTQVDTLIFGTGIGATGLGAKLGSSGTGMVNFDNGILEMFFNFGLMSIGIFAALAMIIINIFRFASLNRYTQLSSAIAVSVIAQLVFSNSLGGIGGMLTFPMVAIVVGQRNSILQRRALHTRGLRPVDRNARA